MMHNSLSGLLTTGAKKQVVHAALLAFFLGGLSMCKEDPPVQVAGSWDTTYDGKVSAPMTLTQSGANITGDYKGPRPGKISATAKGLLVQGTWNEGPKPSEHGTIIWTVTNGGKEFEGTYTAEDGKTGGRWWGKKK